MQWLYKNKILKVLMRNLVMTALIALFCLMTGCKVSEGGFSYSKFIIKEEIVIRDSVDHQVQATYSRKDSSCFKGVLYFRSPNMTEKLKSNNKTDIDVKLINGKGKINTQLAVC